MLLRHLLHFFQPAKCYLSQKNTVLGMGRKKYKGGGMKYKQCLRIALIIRYTIW